jgi:hypothetical protein
MNGEEIIELAAVLSVVVLPMMAVTLRLTLRPLVEAILRLREGLRADAGPPLAGADAAELARLREEVARLHRTVARLQEAEAFHRALEGPAERRGPG